MKPESLEALGIPPDTVELFGMEVPIGPRELAKAFAGGMVDYLADGENIAGAAGAFILPTLVCSRMRRVPFLVCLLVGLAGNQAFRLAYRTTRDIHDLANIVRADLINPPTVHSVDCPAGCSPSEHSQPDPG